MERRAIRSDHISHMTCTVHILTHPGRSVATSSGREDPGLPPGSARTKILSRRCGRVNDNVRRARGRAGPRRGPRGPGGTSA